MAKRQVVKEGWFYLGTYFQGEYGDRYRSVEERSPKCVMLARHLTLYRTPGGKLKLSIESHGLEFPDEAAMVDEIEAKQMSELPKEADGDPRYVPPGFDPHGLDAAMVEAW